MSQRIDSKLLPLIKRYLGDVEIWEDRDYFYMPLDKLNFLSEVFGLSRTLLYHKKVITYDVFNDYRVVYAMWDDGIHVISGYVYAFDDKLDSTVTYSINKYDELRLVSHHGILWDEGFKNMNNALREKYGKIKLISQ